MTKQRLLLYAVASIYAIPFYLLISDGYWIWNWNEKTLIQLYLWRIAKCFTAGPFCLPDPCGSAFWSDLFDCQKAVCLLVSSSFRALSLRVHGCRGTWHPCFLTLGNRHHPYGAEDEGLQVCWAGLRKGFLEHSIPFLYKMTPWCSLQDFTLGSSKLGGDMQQRPADLSLLAQEWLCWVTSAG